MLNIAVLDYGMGNLASVCNAIDAVGYDVQVVNDPHGIELASHLIIPGVGAFRQASDNLRERGLQDAIRAFAAEGKPVLGICLGMQILADSGDEGGKSTGLGLIPGHVAHMETALPVPHVGWNNLDYHHAHPIFAGVKSHVDFYFVHSFHFQTTNNQDLVATCDYGDVYAAVVARNNVVGTQFHPEKSQDNGLKILENFCEWDGRC